MSGFGISGIGSGIDWSSYVNSVVKAQQDAVVRTLGKKQNDLDTQNKEYSNLKGLVSNLNAAASALTFADDFKLKTVNSSDATVITGSAAVNALTQSLSVSVEQLATNEVWQASFTGVNDSVTSSDQDLTITVRGKVNTIHVTAGTKLTDLANQINQVPGLGLSATVYDTGAGGATPARLSIVDQASGKFNPDQTPGVNFNLGFSSGLTALNTASFGASPVVEGKDAMIYINGDSANKVYSDTNAVENVLPGVTLNLLSSVPGKLQTVTVTESAGNAIKKIQDFVDKYNAIVTEIEKVTAYDPNATTQVSPLAGDSGLRGILTQLQSTITSTVSGIPTGNAIHTLAELGITSQASTTGDTTSANGTLIFDNTAQAKLADLMNSHYQDVVTFFQGIKSTSTAPTGFGTQAVNAVNQLIDSQNGSITAKLVAIAADTKRVDDEIQKKAAAIDTNQQFLKDKFARLEVTLSNLTQQQSSLNSALNSIGLNNTAISKMR